MMEMAPASAGPARQGENFLFLFFKYFIYLFIYLFIYFWLRWVLVVAHGLFVAAHGLLSSCGPWAPEHVGSVVYSTRAL